MFDIKQKAELRTQLEMLRVKAREQLNIDLTDEQLDKFSSYTYLLLEWNEKVNLTAITELSDIIIKHFLDSLVFVKWLNKYYHNQKFILGDLGTGAGFPGIPIKIVLPDVKVILIDALAKRLNFLSEVNSQLDLKNIETCHARAEDIGRDIKYRQIFDVVVARAVAELPVLLEYSTPLIKVGGRIFSAKGVDPEQEVTSSKNALKVLNCEVEHIEKYRLAEGADNRSIIVVRKSANTPAKYPRQAGKPKKDPL